MVECRSNSNSRLKVEVELTVTQDGRCRRLSQLEWEHWQRQTSIVMPAGASSHALANRGVQQGGGKREG